MSEPVIHVENLGKVYPLEGGASGGLLSRLRGERKPRELRWALRDVSFQVMPGEAVGILGHNGAGKSTLLKILARVTRPSTGRFEIRGRVAALLELQAGFHPEWTGRQNVFAKGATMGATRAEVRRRFDEIVAFAEMEDAIDLPVRRYSTGMGTRLALATVLHLESDILIVDEALAGGDARFQQRCRRRLAQIGSRGTTLLLVSHRPSTVAATCHRGITLDAGRVVVDGTAEEAINAYLLRLPPSPAASEVEREPAPARSAGVEIRGVRVCSEAGATIAAADVRSAVGVEVTFDVLEPGLEVKPALTFHNEVGVCAFSVVDDDPTWRGRPRPEGRYRAVAWLPAGLLAPGSLRVGARLWSWQPGATPEVRSHVLPPADGAGFELLAGLATAADPDLIPGPVRPTVPWTTRFRAFGAGADPDLDPSHGGGRGVPITRPLGTS